MGGIDIRSIILQFPSRLGHRTDYALCTLQAQSGCSNLADLSSDIFI